MFINRHGMGGILHAGRDGHARLKSMLVPNTVSNKAAKFLAPNLHQRS